jgi:phospholipid/cholesterol/gamma-HCH transport system ATP-binding protein
MQTKIIEVENLSVRFGNRTVLKNVSFSAYANQITIILGRSGCGKTTVLKHLIGLYPLRHGKITIMGTETGNLDETEQTRLSLKMGVLFQNGALLNSLTIAENVAIALEQHTDLSQEMIDKLVRLKLELVELGQALSLHPAEISGGMRKRAALARAIALDPPLLFCDEPSAGLDPVTLLALDNLILKLKNQLGMTIVLVTHEPASIFRLADRIIFLDEGRVLFEGELNAALKAGIPEIDHFFHDTGKTG